MQDELVVLQPQIVQTQIEVEDMMKQITIDKESIALTKAQVEIEEKNANEKADAAKLIADDAQKDLAEAIPALEEAVKCLNDLKKSDIDEVKSLKTPPSGVVLTIKVCCLMFDVKPIKKNDPNQPGKKIDDYWEAGQKGLLTDAKIFLNNLMTFDKDNIPDKIIKSISVFMDDPTFTPAAIERSKNPIDSYIDYIDSLPLHAEPEVFGMHDNANITCAITEADNMFNIILSLQPRGVSSGGGISREDQIIEMAKSMASQLIEPFDIEHVSMIYPTDYHESMNTVLVQELQRYNRLLQVMHSSLVSLQRALKGLVVLSSELEDMSNAIFDQKVPSIWNNVSYPSLKPLSPWFQDLLQRLEFLSNWIEHGVPSVYWISGFFFPQGYLTAILQNYARKYLYPIDTVSFSYHMMNESLDELKYLPPKDGSYISGLFIEGARFNKRLQSLIDPKPKELFSNMPVIHMLPVQHREIPTSGIYRCPVYKILTRTGTLSTTGHSTNFVTWIEIPSNKETIYRSSLVSETNAQIQYCDQDYWINAGVACFCSLKY
eukprot:gene16877-22365_t